MEILFITANLPYPPTDGGKIRVFSLLRSLSERHKVSVVSFIRPTEDQSAIDDLRAYCSGLWLVPRNPHYTPWRLVLGLVGTTPFPIINYWDSRMADLLEEVMKQRSFDVVQAESVHMAQYCQGVKSITILDLLGIESFVMQRYAQRERHLLKRVYAEITSQKLAQYERRACRWFTHCLVCSKEDRRLLEEATGVDNASLIPNGVDVETFRPDGVKAPENNRIVFVGRMDYHANVDGVRWFCEEVLPMVRAHRPDVLFQIVGGYPTKEVRRLAIPAQVEVTGFVEDVRPYLREATVVVVPLRVGGGTRLKILEALAMGKAIVSTTVGAEGIELTPERHLLTADQPEEMYHQILRLLKHADLRASLGKAGRSLVEERYSWKAIGQRLEHVYERCLQSTHPSGENLQNMVSPRQRSGHRLPKL